MHLAFLRFAIRYLMPATWLGVAVLGLAAPRGSRAGSLAAYAATFLGSAFVTRLAVEEHETRWQIAGFALGAFLIEAIRARRSGRGFDVTFWLAAAAASAIGASAARPIAHGYDVSSW